MISTNNISRSSRQRGFSAVEVVIILAVVLVIGFAGWFVWNKQQQKDKEATGQKQSQSSQSTEVMVDPTTDWATYTNAPGKFSFKHPKTWVFADHPENCVEGSVLFASTAAALGICASENGGQMGVFGTAGDVRANYGLDEGYTDVVTAQVTADGVTGTRQSGTASGQEDGEGPGALPDGTKVVQYVFYTNDRTYVPTYTQKPSYPDDLKDFDILVTKTLQFGD